MRGGRAGHGAGPVAMHAPVPPPPLPTASPAPPRSRLAAVLGVDSRSLALLRVCLAAVVLFDLVDRARFLEANYTDGGPFPRAFLAPQAQFSLYFLGSGGSTLPALLFALTGVCAALLLVGWRTRLMTALTWWLVVCLQVRNPLLTNNGDVLLRALLFWGMFVPLGRSFSLDARRRGHPGPARVLSFGSAALVLQFVLLYLSAGVVKLTPDWEAGNAVQLILGQEQFGRPLGAWLRGQAELARVLTFATLGFEILGPLLLLVPWRTRLLRGVCVPGFWLLQLGLGLSLELGLFPWVSTIASVVFLGSGFWSWVARPFRAAPRVLPVETPHGAAGLLGQGLAAALLAWILALNAPILLHRPSWRGLEQAWPSRALGMIQNWRLYAIPPLEDQGFQLVGVRPDGRVLDLLERGQGERWDWVRRVHAEYRTRYMLWRLGLGRNMDETRALLTRHVEWVCREWSATQAERLTLARVRFVRLGRRITLEGHGPLERVVLAEAACGPAGARPGSSGER